MKLRRLLVLGGLISAAFTYGLFAPVCQSQSISSSQVNVSLVTDEADAVLAILAERRANGNGSRLAAAHLNNFNDVRRLFLRKYSFR